MGVNRDLALAAIAGLSGTPSVAFFAPKGATLPADVSSALDVGFLDSGYLTEDGLTKSVDESTTDITPFGVTAPIRTLITASKISFKMSFQESNKVSLAVYNRLPLTGTGSLVPSATGAVDFTEGLSRIQEYAACFNWVDGRNIIRAVVPVLQVTDRDDQEFKPNAAIVNGVKCTAYPGSDGVAVHWYYLLDALKTG